MSQITLTEHQTSGYILLTPTYCPPREGPGYHQYPHTVDQLRDIRYELNRSQIVALDYETQGGDYTLPGFGIVGIGLAWSTGSAYIDVSLFSGEIISEFMQSLGTHPGLIAHNVYFDGGVYRVTEGQHADWHMCTYSLLAMLSNEGVPGRHWGLKVAQVELLLWENSNERELDEWLVINGHYLGARRLDSTEDYLRLEYQTGGLRPDKSQMWRAPPTILGHYCILDAESTYLLYTRVLRPAIALHPRLWEFTTQHWVPLISTLIDQRLRGMRVDRAGLLDRERYLLTEIAKIEEEFTMHPEVWPHICAMEAGWAQLHVAKEPAQYTRTGIQSKNWTKWRTRLTEINQRLVDAYRFNIDSGPQLRELLLTRMGYESGIQTPGGEASVGSKALRRMGGLGTILVHRAEYVKELSYIRAYLDLTVNRDTIHPSYRTPGTSTGRLSSKDPNIQQVPKSKAVMGLFSARPGYTLVDLDFAALEPTVLTEFSRDESMWRIYGEGMPPNDIYLFVGAHIPGRIGQAIRAAGYDPLAPTSVGIAAAKKYCKSERSICKTVVLACQYGAGVRKVGQTLEEQEIYLPLEEVAEIHAGYWRVFPGVKDFGRALQFERRRNGGYVVNGLGRPMAIPADYDQDTLNRFTQSTGHDILVRYISILVRLLDQSGLEWYPYIIDWHDAATVEVPIGTEERIVALFLQAVTELNEQLGGEIRLRGTPTVGYTLADVKEPEE